MVIFCSSSKAGDNNLLTFQMTTYFEKSREGKMRTSLQTDWTKGKVHF